MLTKRVLTEAEASLVKEIQKDEPTWDRAESVEVSILKPSWILLRHDHGQAGGSLYPCNLWQFRFGRYGLPLDSQRADDRWVATSDHLGKDLPWRGHCHPGSQSNCWYEAPPQVNLLQGHLYPKSSCARPGQSMAEQSQRNCKAKLIVNGVWFDEAFPWVALFL